MLLLNHTKSLNNYKNVYFNVARGSFYNRVQWGEVNGGEDEDGGRISVSTYVVAASAKRSAGIN